MTDLFEQRMKRGQFLAATVAVIFPLAAKLRHRLTYGSGFYGSGVYG